MEAMQSQAPLSAADVLKEFQRENISVVQRADFLTSTNYLRIIAGADRALSLEESSQWVRIKLLDIALTIDDPKIRDAFLEADISERELIGVLNYASSRQIVEFSRQLMEVARRNPEAADFLQDKLDNVLYFASTEEKIAILNIAIARDTDISRGLLVQSVLRSSEGLDELELIIKEVGRDKLGSIEDSGTDEYVSFAEVQQIARSTHLPELPSSEASLEDL